MENFTVRDLGESEQKSTQQIEQELLDKHEASLAAHEEVIVPETVVEESTKELQDDDVLSYIKNRYNKEVNSIDELFNKREEAEEMDVEYDMSVFEPQKEIRLEDIPF